MQNTTPERSVPSSFPHALKIHHVLPNFNHSALHPGIYCNLYLPYCYRSFVPEAGSPCDSPQFRLFTGIRRIQQKAVQQMSITASSAQMPHLLHWLCMALKTHRVCPETPHECLYFWSVNPLQLLSSVRQNLTAWICTCNTYQSLKPYNLFC